MQLTSYQIDMSVKALTKWLRSEDESGEAVEATKIMFDLGISKDEIKMIFDWADGMSPENLKAELIEKIEEYNEEQKQNETLEDYLGCAYDQREIDY